MDNRKKTMKKIKQILIVPLLLFVMELFFLLLAVMYGRGGLYIKPALILWGIVAIIYVMSVWIKANERIVVYSSLLLSIGVFVQIMTIPITSAQNSQTSDIVRSMVVGMIFAAVAFVVLLMPWFYWHYYDVVILAIMLVNILILLVMFLFATGVEGDVSKINLFGVQPLELVKLCYIFVLSGLLCKPERKQVRIFRIRRTMLALVYMLVNTVFFLLLKELGTLLILILLGLSMMFMFCEKWKDILIAVTVHAFMAFVGIILAVTRFTVIGQTLYNRFLYFVHPERELYGRGYQYILLKKSLALSELLPINADRYKLVMPAQQTDLVFAKLLQLGGVLLSILVLVIYILLLADGFRTAYKVTDIYYRGMSMGISILLAFQGIIHIAYNVGLMPITGVPLLYISRGGSNQMVSLVLTAILLVISANGLKRIETDEMSFERKRIHGTKFEKVFKI